MSDKNTSIGKARLQGATCALLLIVAVNSICTQFVADRMTYHPALGSPLIGQIYSPFEWWKWMGNFYSSSPETYSYAFFIFVLGTIFSLLFAKLLIGIKGRSSRKHEGLYGSAAFATYEQIKETGLIHDKQGAGVYCGGYYNEKTGRTHYLRHDGPEHIAVFAPTRSGKGVGLVVPTLLSWPESVFVLDIKGENYAMTAGWRHRCTNNIVLRFDPAEEFGSCAWNPLGEIRFGTRYQISDTQNISLMVVDTDGRGLFDHWRSAAHELLSGIILHALYKSAEVGREPCLLDCAHMLTGVGDFASPGDEYDDGDPRALSGLFLEMQNVSLPERDSASLEAGLYIKGVGRRMATTADKELLSIISTANNALSLYRDPIVGENTSRSDFKVADLMDHDRPVSLYFITNPNNLVRMKPLARLLLTRIVAGLAGRMEYDEGRSKTVHNHRLLMMLDEFPSLGKLDVFENALAFIAGYGIKAYIITQDLNQIYKAYGNHESIVSNCHIRIAFAPNNQETAERISKMTGQTTVINEQVSVSGKRFGLVAGQFSSHFHSTQRPLMTPKEVSDLAAMHKQADSDKPGEMLVFVSGQPVIRGRQTPYFLDPTFDARSRIEPPKTSDVVRKTTPQKGDIAS